MISRRAAVPQRDNRSRSSHVSNCRLYRQVAGRDRAVTATHACCPSRVHQLFAIHRRREHLGNECCHRLKDGALDQPDAQTWGESDRYPLLHWGEHVTQMQRYLTAVGAPRGAIVYMSTGEVVSFSRYNVCTVPRESTQTHIGR